MQSRTSGQPAPAEFDIETLKQRGIDPKVAEYFRTGPKFPEGRRLITLIINGTKLGSIEALFDREGQLCFDKAFLTKAQLNLQDERFRIWTDANTASPCYDFVAAYPQTSVTLQPNREEVYLVVPQQAQLRKDSNAPLATTGGTGGLFNYNVMMMQSTFNSNSTAFWSASTQLGFNAGDWIVRSQQAYIQDDHRVRFNQIYTYAQRTFADYKTVMQAGQININSPVFAGVPITGIQLLPEGGLLGSSGNGAIVQGIAQGQATVEVRQAGALVYSTIVPQGPFMLSGIPLLNSNTDLDVTVREADGPTRRFVVPAASFRTAVLPQPGYSMAMGKVRSLDAYTHGMDQPWLATGVGSWNLSSTAVGMTGILASNKYQSMGGGVDISLPRSTLVSGRTIYSSAASERVRGAQASLAIGTQVSDALGLSLSSTQQTKGFRDLADTLTLEDSRWYRARYKSQYTAAGTWSNATLGSFVLSYSPSRSFDGDSVDRLFGSWSRTFKGATVTANIERSMRDSDGRRGNAATGSTNRTAFYLTISIPLGRRSMNTYATRRGDDLRTGVKVTDLVNDQFGYTLSAERDTGSDRNVASTTVSATPRYAQLNMGYTQDGPNRTYTGQISGGVVLHRGGLSLSPYPIQETFGIVEVGDISGIKVATPSGPVWTDPSGQAVIPQLSAYQTSLIQVDTKTLPRRVDILNGVQELDAGRGSVNYVKFHVVKAHRMLISAHDDSGAALPMGSSVLDSNGTYVTTVLSKGDIFLSDAEPGQKFKVAMPDERSCELVIAFPKESNDDGFYDTAPGVCHFQ
jgi:outer membrane usher protein FimD/PapC